MKLLDNRFSRGLLFLLLMIGFTSVASAQRAVSGTVTDAESGDPLIGASVLVTGTSTGTITDFDGNFSINVPANAETLTFSYTGFSSQEVTIGDQSVFSVELSSGETLEEVVVIGYGSVTQNEVTSAVTSVDSKDFNAGNINDPTQLVQGKVAGLQISKPGGNPNQNATLRLRGVSSFGGNQGPLIIIDGVVGADLQTVDPADIESINVLKDGSAAAIYGVQASSGVVLVTTKRGRAGAGQLEYRGYISADQVAGAPESASASEYLRLLEEANPGASDDPTNNAGADTDWIDEVSRTALSHVHNLSYSGGSGGTTYRASANYRDIQGIGVTNDGFRQLNGRLSVTQKALNDKLTLQADVTATDRDADEFNVQAFRYATIFNPTSPIFVDEPGTNVREDIFELGQSNYGGYYETVFDDAFNPVAIANQTSAERQTTTNLYSFRAGYDFTDDLKLQVNYSRQRKQQVYGFFASRESKQAGNGQADNITSPVKGTATRQTFDDRNDLFEVTGTYNLDLGNNSLELLGGYSWQKFQNQSLTFSGRGFPTNATGFNNIGFSQDITNGVASNSSFRGESIVIGFFGRARFSLGDAYNITASVRRDGSSRNGPDNQWDIFPSVSASADLVKALDLSGGVNSLKLRAGYGITGALPSGQYNYLQRFNQAGQFIINGNPITAIGPVNNENPSLRFEKKGEFNVGLDFAFLDYKLTGSLDYYIRNVKDLILPNVPVSSPPFLFGTVEANVDNLELTSSGIELALSYDAVNTEKFSYTPSITFATYNTMVEDNGETEGFIFADGFELPTSAPGSPGQNDDRLTQIRFGDEFGGIYTRVIDLEASEAAGTFVFVDQDGDAGEDGGDPRSDKDDRVLVGNGLPDFSIGFQNQFRFGAVDFSFFIRGDFGHDLANMNNNFYGLQNNLNARPVDNVVVTDEFVGLEIQDQAIFSDLYVEDASFLVLDNAQLGFNINLPESSPFRSIRPYIAGQNLFYITGYSGFDPNVRYNDNGPGNGTDTTNGNPLVQGIDRRTTYWRTRTFTFGVSVGL
ncbi:SusC/RagA family TonB-linked outer membrane protein [Lewinellaceae bacterium SD302]|nr:SusC/RagA family TonB-linked outer membrane protein [Lewinellaceae bacterium SD302]